MTIASNRTSVDLVESDFVPGSTEVEWAEHAYLHRSEAHSGSRNTNVRAVTRRSSRLRFAAAAAVILLVMATCVFLMTTQASSRPPVQRPPARTLTSSPSKASLFGGPVVTPPLLRPSPFSYPEFVTTPNR